MKLYKKKKEKKVIYNINNNQILFSFLLKIGSFIGHSKSTLLQENNEFLLGTKNEVVLHKPELILKSLISLKSFFSQAFYYRLNFILIFLQDSIVTDKLMDYIKTKILHEVLWTARLLGYLKSKWKGGTISNWNVLYLYIKNLILRKKKFLSKRDLKLLRQFSGILYRKTQPTFPDYIISLSCPKNVLQEIYTLNIPVISLIDTNEYQSPNSLILLGNNDSTQYVEYIFNFMEQAAIKGVFEEQQHFYIKMLSYLNKMCNLNKNV